MVLYDSCTKSGWLIFDRIRDRTGISLKIEAFSLVLHRKSWSFMAPWATPLRSECISGNALTAPCMNPFSSTADGVNVHLWSSCRVCTAISSSDSRYCAELALGLYQSSPVKY